MQPTLIRAALAVPATLGVLVMVGGCELSTIVPVSPPPPGGIVPSPLPAALVTIATDGTEANQSGNLGAISADGKLVVFRSDATDIDPGDTNNSSDIFLYDARIQRAFRISKTSVGIEGNDYSSTPRMSADGSVIAFESDASNLTDADSGIFILDRRSGEIDYASINSAGEKIPLSRSYHFDISPDGRYVVTGQHPLHLYDRQTGTAERLPLDTYRTLYDPVISRDARVIAFRSSTGLAIWPRGDGAHPRLVTGIDGEAIGALEIDISDDGNVLVFQSGNDNVVFADTNNVDDIFAYFVDRDELLRASPRADGTQDVLDAIWPSVSGDGRFVVFSRELSVWRYDLATERLDLVSKGRRGRISADGAYVAVENGGSIFLHHLAHD